MFFKKIMRYSTFNKHLRSLIRLSNFYNTWLNAIGNHDSSTVMGTFLSRNETTEDAGNRRQVPALVTYTEGIPDGYSLRIHSVYVHEPAHLLLAVGLAEVQKLRTWWAGAGVVEDWGQLALSGSGGCLPSGAA